MVLDPEPEPGSGLELGSGSGTHRGQEGYSGTRWDVSLYRTRGDDGDGDADADADGKASKGLWCARQMIRRR